MMRRANRSLFLIDIAVPRNVEPTAHELDNLYLYNIDDLEAIAGENLKLREGEIEKARNIINTQSSEFWSWIQSIGEGEEKSLKHNPGYLRDFLT
jgi:glutamyl-tRNA reductase